MIARHHRLRSVFGLFLAATFHISGSIAQEITYEGELRARYESLDGQFRAGGAGSDQALFLRSLLKAEIDTGNTAFGVELQDSRVYLDDSGTPLSSSYVNALDFLQIYATLEIPGLQGSSSTGSLTMGRQTVSIGSKRQIERVSYANVIKSYTGAHYVSSHPRGDEFHAIYVVPVDRLPTERESIGENEITADKEQWNRHIWGLHYRRADILPKIVPDLWGELFVYGLNGRDTSDTPTPNRDYVTPGFRLYRKPVAGQADLDIEGALRYGSRRASSNPADTEDLDVEASMLFAALGYTFDAPWQPRLALEYYWASGDDDPDDDRFDQYERLFGSRRTDLNNTSLHGPLTPANLSAPGVRVEIKPSDRWDARLAYSAAFLASPTDSWVIAGLRDPSGQSGDFIGHTMDGRIQYWLVQDRLRLEVGASVFDHGEFAKTVPGAPEADRTLFGYSQIAFGF